MQDEPYTDDAGQSYLLRQDWERAGLRALHIHWLCEDMATYRAALAAHDHDAIRLALDPSAMLKQCEWCLVEEICPLHDRPLPGEPIDEWVAIAASPI